MSFVLSELVVEQLIRNGLEEIKEEIDIALTDIFGNLSTDLLNSKYAEDYDKIKTILLHSQVHVLHAFPMGDTQLPSFSIHLQSDAEETPLDVLGDFAEEANVSIEPEVVLDNITFDSFDSDDQIAYLDDSYDLSDIYYNRWLVLADGTEIRVLEVNDTNGNKYIKLETDLSTINLSSNKIVSAVSNRTFRQHEIPSRENIMIGVHSVNSLLTKYLYHILKYILYKNRENFWNKGIQLQTFQGSDFTMNQGVLPEQVFSRFLTMNFIARNSWRHNELTVIDSMGDNPSNNDKEVIYTHGPQPDDGLYKPRVERDEGSSPREDEELLTLGSAEEDE